jgi:Kdo2-lipid IVA lauroyltransferase/acyltransferase
VAAIGFYIFYFFAWSLGLLPRAILYLISDILFFLIFYVSTYRKKIVYTNLRRAFPEKSKDEIKQIARRFCKHLCDLIVEIAKQIHMSEAGVNQRISYKNLEYIEAMYQQKKGVVAVLGHYANWEMLVNIPNMMPHHVLAIYKPIRNKYFDKLFIDLRSKFGAELIPMKSSFRSILTYQQKGTPVLVYTVADQTPTGQDIQYWTTFMNQDTPVYLGSEKIARKTGFAVVFFKLSKIKRGYYELEVVPLCENPGATADYEITELHTRYLESVIREKPEYWLWSHRRWKHKRVQNG